MMLREKRELKLPNGSEIRSWVNGDQPMPDWLVLHQAGPREPNGTFLIKSRGARQRVHPGHVIIERAGIAYTCPPEDVEALVDQLRFASELAKLPVGPGKALDRAGCSKRKSAERDPRMPARRYPTALGMPPSIEMRHPDELKIDESYQRSIDTEPSRRLIGQIAARWDWRLCVPLMVSKRDDGLYVIDGQHRLSAAKRRGDIPFIPCCISTYESPADEARMFVAANRSRRTVNHLDDFHAAIVAKDEDAIEIANVVAAAGLRVSRKTGSKSWIPGEVTFTAAIRKVMSRHGDKLAKDVLIALARAFPDQVLSNGSSIFTALASISITPPPGGIDRDRLEMSLRAFDMKGWGTFMVGCKGGDDRRRAMREAILMKYEEVGPAARAA